MIRLVVFAIGLLFAGACTDEVQPPGPAHEPAAQAAVKAKKAIVELMRDDVAVFEGVDPAVMLSVPLTQQRANRCSWGAFTTDVDENTYQATIDLGYCTHFYDGRFEVDAAGQWTAQKPTTSHLLETE